MEDKQETKGLETDEKKGFFLNQGYTDYIGKLRQDLGKNTNDKSADKLVLQTIAGLSYKDVLQTLSDLKILKESEESLDLLDPSVTKILGENISFVQALLNGNVMTHKRDICERAIN